MKRSFDHQIIGKQVFLSLRDSLWLYGISPGSEFSDFGLFGMFGLGMNQKKK